MKLKFNSFYLKLFAVLFMLIDHIAHHMISPELIAYSIMRMIGRLAAPIFWFCFVEGYKRTRSKTKYKIRLICSAVIMAIGNIAMRYICDTSKLSLLKPNMFFSFLMCAVMIDIIELCIKTKTIWQSVLLFVLSIFIVLFVGQHCEYSYFIISFVLLYHFIKNDTIKNLLYVCIMAILSLLLNAPLQIFTIVSLFFFMAYDPAKPKHSWKYFFYVFYPMHIWIFVILAKLLLN